MSSGTQEGSEDVTDFLRGLKELGDRRQFEDEERNRKLEEEILQGRKERQARRAERARSISPTKSSPANTPTGSKMSAALSSSLSEANPPSIGSPQSTYAQGDTAVDHAMDRLTGSATSPKKENAHTDGGREAANSTLKRETSIRASPSSAMPSRKSTLSWQQRPTSQSGEIPRSRPLSMVATENAARSPRGTPEPLLASPGEQALTRDQIAQSLATKDPAWFRQTADRGLNSPAYRRNQVEDEDRADHGSNSSRVQMPGMSREGSVPDKDVEDAVDRSSSPPRSGGGVASRNSGFGSPIPITSTQRFEPPNMDSVSDARTLAMSPSQGRISPERLDRAPSPTKGMGGFVQSAMMKRSDSVNKRWSVQSPPGLNRGNSVASNRNSHDPSTTLSSVVTPSGAGSRPSSLSRDNSPRPSSRPTSSHAVTQDGQPGPSNSMRNSISARTNDTFVKPGLPASRSQTNHDIKIDQENDLQDFSQAETTPPSSPSKTMDPRRWSPTKSSWLESALNKPDSPKPKPTPPPQQPAWMSEINKAKQKGIVDMNRSPTVAPKHEVSIGGLLRLPPPGGLSKPISIVGLPAGFSSGAVSKSRSESTSSSNGTMFPGGDSSPPQHSPTATFKSSSAAGKPKPETPPKKDFRANLKPRSIPPANGKDEPEFKNIFGQLRSTKTQNYVAPDELKNNITRGKSSLNITGGPKKTERKDEFKDAILKKKEDFKRAQMDGKGITRESGVNQVTAIPEALAKRQALGRSNTATAESSSSAASPYSDQESPQPALPRKEASASGRLQGSEAIGSKLAGRFNPGLAGLLARGPPSMASDTSRSSSPASSQRTVNMSMATSAEPEAPGPQLMHMTKGRARGPRRKAPSAAHIADAESEGDSKVKAQTTSAAVDTASSKVFKSPELVEAIQPKLQADIENIASRPTSPQKLDFLKRRSQFLQEAPDMINKADPQLDTPKPLSPTKKANATEVTVKDQEVDPGVMSTPNINPNVRTAAPTPTTPSKEFDMPSTVASSEFTKPRLSPLSPKKLNKNDSNFMNLLSQSSEKPPPPKPHSPDRPRRTPLSPKKAGVTASKDYSLTPSRTPIAENASSQSVTSKDVDSVPATLVRSTAATWDRPSVAQAATSSPRARSPIKLPTHEDEKAAMIEAGLRPASLVKAPVGLTVQTTRISTSSRPLPTPARKGTLSSPHSATLSPSSATKSSNSLVPQASEASILIAEFFGQDNNAPDYVADTAMLLSERPNQFTSIKTLGANMYQFSSDGKKIPVPNHQERLLFEGNMYICVHSFGNAAGKKITEVYFWFGDEVPSSTVEGAQTFAQREAKSAGGKLVKISQGKETPEFFQALGGIIVIRRGSSNKYDSLAPHILCGRKHLGQITFDEVDYSPASLCSGFPYLISTQSGKSYLWKGKGSGIDELSCARLIGMDFGLTGEVEEVEDGREPASFLKEFGNGASIPKSADHWRMKPNYTKYCGRLFCADSAVKSQIIEMSPFYQADVSPSNIYVLDAFFEIYIVVGSKAQSQYAAFHNALMFAQEYGILAAGMEDRPYVPVTTVVLEGIPKDMKSVFRKWREGLTPTVITPTSPGLQRGRSLRVVPLTAALEATRR